MGEINLDVVPLLESERAGALVRAEAEQGLGRDHVAASALAARDPFELPQLLERVDAHVRVRADADADAALADALDRQESVTEVRLGRRAGADARAGAGDQVELRAVGMRGMHDRRALAQATRPVEQFDRTDAVLYQAFLDLARLLVRVHVQRQPLRGRVPADLLQPVRRARAHGVGGEPDCNAPAAEVLDLPEILGSGFLAEPRQPAATVCGQQEDDADPGLLRSLDRCERLVEAEIVELADHRVAGGAQFPVDVHVLPAHGCGGLTLRLAEHELPPGPEVRAAAASAQGALEGVAVGVDESGQREGLGHGRILSTPWRPAPFPRLCNSSPTPLRSRAWH